ncbi:hypothetical protein E8E12_008312 [Didymella heteroderae]|uniref:Uncharacterized protein n=1 Tax=Didymella heteroderae TaxID=1769908 RepID=A0A9P4WX20_9PLEO|nr:hypothetical protein E8E12_008312 [Didymella heteroderae]
MASPDTDGTDKKCDPSPPSPELGMGTPRGSEVNDLNLSELEEQAVADAELLEATAAEKEGEAAAPLQGEEASLPRSRQTQQLPPESAQQASPSSGDAKLMTPAPTCPPIRRSARTKNTLIYDQKYHPMDDTIRPSQAAKRHSSSEPAPKVPESTTRHSFSPEPFVKHDDKVAGTDQALRLGIGCRYADPNVWPAVKGLPFRIFTERMEDQLSAEAEAASPFHCEDDNKENDVTNPELMPRPSPLDGISIIPASYYHRAPGLYNIPAHSSVASNAFYVHPQFEASPYGLGWNDGAQDMHNNGNNDCLTSDYMRILGSSEHLPRTSTPTAHCRSRGHNDVVTSSPAQEFESLECLR